jgi:hypothetical protein
MIYVSKHAVGDVELVISNCTRFSKTTTAKYIFTIVISPYNKRNKAGINTSLYTQIIHR